MDATSGQRALRATSLSMQFEDQLPRCRWRVEQAPRFESYAAGLSPGQQRTRSCRQKGRRRLRGRGLAGCAVGSRSAVGSAGGFRSVVGPLGEGRVWSGCGSGRSASPGRVSSSVGSGGSGARAVGGHAPLQVSLRETCVVATPRSDAPEGCTVSRPPRCWLLLVDRARSCV